MDHIICEIKTLLNNYDDEKLHIIYNLIVNVLI